VSDEDYMSAVRTKYDETIVIDALNVSNWDSPAVFESVRAGGITAFNATLVTWENYQQTMAHVAAWKRRFEAMGKWLLPVLAADDILRAKRESRVGVILGWQNATPIENDLDNVKTFFDLGVRIIQLTFHERNLIGNGCMERRDDGLSHFGLDAVREMNRLGILIDLSHCGDRTTLEAIEYSEMPVAFTHANARDWHDHRRNKTDEALKSLARHGGVVGATAFNMFLRGGMDSTLDDYTDAIDDLVQRVGIDHVGVGTDFTQDQPQGFWDYIGSQQGTKLPSSFYDGSARREGLCMAPQGLETPDKMPELAAALHRRGYDAPAVAKILGENWMRLFREVWR